MYATHIFIKKNQKKNYSPTLYPNVFQVTKLVTPDEQATKLFKLVSLLTGWKNSLKGVGYFLGSALLPVSYELALAVMLG